MQSLRLREPYRLGGRYETSTDPLNGALRRRLAAALCTLALALNVLTGVALTFKPAEADVAARALENGWNVICSGAGLIVVDADGNLVPDDQSGAAGSPRCVFCLPLMHGDVAIAQAATVAAPAQYRRLPENRPRTAAPAPTTISSQAWPRAPPTFLIG